MNAINPDVIHFLMQQDTAAVKRIAASLPNDAQEIADRAQSGKLASYDLQLIQGALTDLHHRLTRLRAFEETLPKS